MVRIFLFAVMTFHGLIHLMGVVKGFGYGLSSQLNGVRLIRLTEVGMKVAGIFWLLAFLMFTSAGILFLMRRNWYWIPALIGLAISQTLIVIYWNDAKFGTLPNVIIMVSVVLGLAKFQFDNQFSLISARMKSRISDKTIFITEDGINTLPQSVQQWLRQSNVVGKTNPNSIHVFQKGSMRLKPESTWMEFQSEEYFTVNPPSFVWKANIEASPFLAIAGRDKYENGEGNMLIKPLYLYTLADASGEKINQGTLLRFLAEMTWFPQAAASDYLHWEEIDARHTRVTMKYKDTSASGVFTFNDDGLVSGFEAQRYGDFEGEYRMEKWIVSIKGYKMFGGKKIGYMNDVAWGLKDGEFLWMKMEVTGIGI